MVFIKGFRRGGQGMCQHAAYSHDLGGLRGAEDSILQQGGTQSLALLGLIDRQPTEDSQGNRVRHVASQGWRCQPMGQRA